MTRPRWTTTLARRDPEGTMTPKLLFEERLSSGRTELLFVVLTVLFLFLSTWRGIVSGLDGWTVVLLCFFGFFLFYH